MFPRFNVDFTGFRLTVSLSELSIKKGITTRLNSYEGTEYVKESAEICIYFIRPEPFSRFSVRVVLNVLNPYNLSPRL